MEFDLTEKREFILPRSEPSGLSLFSWQWPVMLSVFCFALLGLAGADGFGEGIVSALLALSLLWAMAINCIDIEEYKKPELFIGEHGFRFGQKGMPEIPWSEVIAVDLDCGSHPRVAHGVCSFQRNLGNLIWHTSVLRCLEISAKIMLPMRFILVKNAGNELLDG